MAKKPPPAARELVVETRFQRLAKRAGGVPKEKAVERAEAEIERAKPGFDEWLKVELRDFASFVKNAAAEEVTPDWIARANFRSRQLRDSATIMGFELLAFIGNSLCEILDSMEAGNEYNMESIVCHMDALTLAGKGSYRRLKPDQVPELTKGLRRVVKRVNNAARRAANGF